MSLDTREAKCRYCEKEKNCLMFSTIKGCFGKIMGDKWGRSGFTVNKKNWVHAADIVRTQDGEYRIKISDIMSPPISYCPKCGRKLL